MASLRLSMNSLRGAWSMVVLCDAPQRRWAQWCAHHVEVLILYPSTFSLGAWSMSYRHVRGLGGTPQGPLWGLRGYPTISDIWLTPGRHSLHGLSSTHNTPTDPPPGADQYPADFGAERGHFYCQCIGRCLAATPPTLHRDSTGTLKFVRDLLPR